MSQAETPVTYTKKQERLIKALCFGVVIVLPLVIGVANLAAFFIVNAKHPESRVADNFYKSALAVYKNNDAQEKARALGITANATMALSSGELSLRLSGQHASPQAVVIRFIHPADSSQDVTLIAKQNANQGYVATLTASIKLFNEVRIKPVTTDDELWELVLLDERGLSAYSQADGLWKAAL